VHATTITPDGRRELLERSRELSMLDEWFDGVAATSHGRLVLVAGEAGVGKTALLQRFCERCRARSLWGASEPLFTPRALGPLLDVAEHTGGELAEVVAAGDKPYNVVGALIRELRTEAPTILVLEDVHWADEATLDVLTLLGRRIAAVPALVLATYRDNELDRAHPLRAVLGEIATREAVSRLQLLPLSADAVSMLAKPRGLDADELYRRTAGNPFFVTEVLDAPGGEIPPTVRDAVLARVARLSPPARTLLEAAAVTPPPVELWLLEALAGPAAGELEECLAAGMLTAGTRDVAFRHELARIAVEESMPPHVRASLHTKALAALRARSESGADVARLAHHADAADDGAAVLRFAPAAAVRASSVGAHREAAAQYERALKFAGEVPVPTRAELQAARARECAAIGRFTESIDAYAQAIEHHHSLGDSRREGDCLRAQSWLLWTAGRGDEAESAARRAVELLETLPPSPELALAYCAVSDLGLLGGDFVRAVECATPALELAQELDDSTAMATARRNIATAEFLTHAHGDTQQLERILAFARQEGLEELAASMFCFLAYGTVRGRAHAQADRHINAGMEYCSEHDLDGWRPFLVAMQAQLALHVGRWDEAARSADAVLAGVETDHGQGLGPGTVVALTVRARVETRRGESAYRPALDEAHRLSEPSRDVVRLGVVAAARAEAAWLEGRVGSVAEDTAVAYEVAGQRGDPWVAGELACWRRRAGIDEPAPSHAAEPYSLELAGDWRSAAEQWAVLGCPYEEALALAGSDDDDALRRALDQLQQLGAHPAAAIVARRLRRRGATGLPRGPRPATRRNPANLTQRELEILSLVARGDRNADIAQRLFLSEKTVAHHVSAVLRKLGVSSRGQASAAAVRLGIAAEDR
jgi:DNA-binding CsgD family transcriptional regulator